MLIEKYIPNIVKLKRKKTHESLNLGDDIIIQEKLDGANALLRRDGDKIRCYSTSTELDENNSLRGFYNFVQENIDVNDLEEDEIIIGKWLIKNKFDYGENMNQFYVSDIYITTTNEFAHYSLVDAVAGSLGLNTVPRFYVGEYQSLEHIQSFVGRTDLGGNIGNTETGEGIVVKNTDYKDRFGNQVFIKIDSKY